MLHEYRILVCEPRDEPKRYSAPHRAITSVSQSDVYGASRRAFTSEEVLGNKFPVPGGGCLRNEAVANTASIYSAFLLQVGTASLCYIRRDPERPAD